jgi:hypothetical protein
MSTNSIVRYQAPPPPPEVTVDTSPPPRHPAGTLMPDITLPCPVKLI